MKTFTLLGDGFEWKRIANDSWFSRVHCFVAFWVSYARGTSVNHWRTCDKLIQLYKINRTDAKKNDGNNFRQASIYTLPACHAFYQTSSIHIRTAQKTVLSNRDNSFPDCRAKTIVSRVILPGKITFLFETISYRPILPFLAPPPLLSIGEQLVILRSSFHSIFYDFHEKRIAWRSSGYLSLCLHVNC